MTTFRLKLKLALFAWSLLFASGVGIADTAFDFVYSGRLTESGGKPIPGPVAMKLTFSHDNSFENPVLVVTAGLENVALQEGLFQIRLNLSGADYAKVFPDVGQPVWVQVTDLTHRPNVPYTAQQVIPVPYAGRIPVDNLTASFGSDGRLTVGPSDAPAANQFLTKDSGGRFVWATPASSANSIQGQGVSATAPTVGQVLKYDGSQWLPQTIAASGGTVTSVSASLPLVVTSATTTPAFTLAAASSMSDGYVTSGDWLSFKGGLSRGGGTMSGSLNMGANTLTNLATPSSPSDAATKSYVDADSALNLKKDGSVALTGPWNIGSQDLSSVGNMALAASKTLGLGVYAADPTTLVTADKGKVWFNSGANQIKYWDGSAVQTLGNAVATGLTNLNGAIGNTQTLAVGNSGSTPGWSTATNTHTLNIPLASVGGVTAGLVSNADYTSFNGKVSSVTAGSGLSGGVINSAGTISLPAVGAAGTYAKVTTDAQGRVSSGTSLGAVDIPSLDASKITTGYFQVANGGTGATSFTANGVLLGSGTSALGVTGPGSQYQSLVAGSGGTPAFGAVDLSQSAAVTGTLPGALGGTGVSSTATFPGSGVIVTEAATETLTNKTLAAATINGASTIGGSTVINTSGSINSGAITATSQTVAGNVIIQGNTTTANKLVLNDRGTTFALTFKAPDLLSASVNWTLPATDGGSGAVLATNGGGTLSWATGLAPTGTASGDLTGSFPNPTLATAGTAGTYTKVITDTKGRVIGSSSLTAADIPNLDMAKVTTGTLSVANGGTGSNTFTNNGILVGSGGLALSATTAGTQYQVFVAGSGGAPGFGALDLSQSLAVTGTLPVSKGGTGVTASTGSGSVVLSNSPTLVAPALGTPASGVATNLTGLPLATGVTGTLPVANGGTGITTGAQNLLFATPSGSSGAPSLRALTTADLPSLSASLITSGTLPVANGGTGVTTSTGTGSVVLSNSPTLVTPALGTPASGIASNLTGLPLTTGVTGTLPVANGGTGVTTGAQNLIFATPSGSSGAPALRSLAAADLPAHSAALITSGTLGVANGGTGLSATPLTNQIPIGNGTGFSLGTLAGGTGVSVTNASGTITIAATADASTKVSKSGDTMTGTLNLPANGLTAGTNQLVLSGGNVGIGTTNPTNKLSVQIGSNGDGVGVVGSTAGPLSPQFSLYDGSTQKGSVGLALGTTSYSLVANVNDFVVRAVNSSSAGNLILSAQNATGGIILATGSSGSNDTSKAVITNAGNVGIGTTNPAAILHIAGATTIHGAGEGAIPSAATIRGANSSGTDIAGANFTFAASNGTGTGGSGSLLFQTAPVAATSTTPNTLTTRLAITPAGNIGIGTTVPGAALDLAGAQNWRGIAAPSLSAAGQGLIYFDSSTFKFKVSENGGAFGFLVGTNGSANFGSNSVTAANEIIGTGDGTGIPASGTLRGSNALGTNVTGGNVVIAAGDGTGLGSSGSIQFQTAPAGTSGTTPGTLATALAIVPNGNVGVGTTSPAGLFDVNGKLTVLGSGNVGIGSSSPGTSLDIANAGAVGGSIFVNQSGTGNTGSSFQINNSSLGRSIYVNQLNASNAQLALDVENAGTGGSSFINQTNTASTAAGFQINNGSLGRSVYINQLNASNAQLALDVENAGTGGSSFINQTNPSSTNPSFQINNSSLGRSVYINQLNSSNNQLALDVQNAGSNTSFVVNQSGTSNSNTAVSITNSGTGKSLAVNTSQFVVQAGGNVGVGTTSPASNLTVVGAGSNSTANSLAYFGSGSGATATNVYGIAIDKSTVATLLLGVNRNSVTGSVPADSPFISTYTTTQPLAIGRGAANGLPSTADIFISASGNVGIGTTSPVASLDIENTSGTGIYFSPLQAFAPSNNIVGNNTIVRFGTNAASYNAGELSFYYSGNGSTSNRLGLGLYGGGGGGITLLGTGNVGIGTTAPVAPLHVAGTTLILGTGEGATPGSFATIRSTNSSGTNIGGSDLVLQAGNGTGTGGSGDIYFKTAAPGATGSSVDTLTERMRITTSGNLGIGTTAPGAKLSFGAPADGTPYIYWNEGAAGNRYGVGQAFQEMQHFIANVGHISFNKGGDLQTAGTNEIMRIMGSGNVGIGTTSPSNTLHVLGSLCVKSIAGNCAGSTAGTIYATTTTVAAADLAEHMPIIDPSLEAGDVVVTEVASTPEGMAFGKSTRPRQENAAGVVSTSPGVVLGSDTASSRPIALAGRVPVNVTMEGGAIAVGDFLVSSSTPGKAMRASGPADAGIIGIALSAYAGTAVSAKDFGDAVAHEAGHQVMMLVHVGAGSQSAVAQLKAEKDEEIAQLKANGAQLKAEAAQMRADAAQMKAFLCSQAPHAPMCSRR